MKKFTMMVAVLAFFTVFTGSALAQTDKEISDAVIKMAKGQWAEEIANPGKAVASRPSRGNCASLNSIEMGWLMGDPLAP